MRRTLFLVVITIFYSTSYCQESTVDHWESIFHSNSNFKYWSSGQGDIASDWRSNNFDDGSWETGQGGIGYGDDDDGTIIESCNAVLLRKEFTIIDRTAIIDAFLFMDYDDAFVAYLNGNEIARSQGLSDPFPSINTLSTVQHDVGSIEKFSINADILSEHLQTGSNTIAIQVHNVSSTSSDLSSNAWLIVGLSTVENNYMDTPEWFSAPTSFSGSNLPIMIIDTENGNTIPDDPKINAYMGIIYDYEDGENRLSDPHNHYSGNIAIERRGNSTQSFPKKPYDFETRSSTGENQNVSFFGWPPENDWILRASYMDHTFIRNPLAMHMSRELGRWASRCKLVEVVLNGEYIGIYILMEKIKRDPGRVDIKELTPEEITEPAISGGYIWEISGFNDNLGASRYMRYPDFATAAPQQIDYIRDFDDNFRNVMSSENYMDEESGYSAWIDVGSFIDEIIVQEAMRNSDAYGWSGYYHKNMGSKIYAGPVWDFDQSAGNSSYPDNGIVEEWLFSHPSTNNTPFFWPLLFEDPVFKYKIRKRWEMMREGKFQTEILVEYIDSVASMLSVPQQREFGKWPVLGVNVWRETNGYEERDSYQKEVDYLKDFLTQRWTWMDDELAKHENPNNSETIEISSKNIAVYPNPAKSHLNFNIDQNLSPASSISIYNHMGVLIRTESLPGSNNKTRVFPLKLDSNMEPGVYIFEVQFMTGERYFGKFVKSDR